MTLEKERALVFCSREICYQSGNFFANRMADAFETLGLRAEVREFTAKDDLEEIFAPLYGKKFKIVLDFNSAVTRMAEDDGTAVPDLIDAPFYSYILDHPLFHYNCLNADVKNLNAIFVDEAQEAYVKRYYPKVKRTLTMPLGASEAVNQKKDDDADYILFMGTYDDPDKIYEMVELSPEPLCSYMKELIEMRLGDPLLPMEDAFAALLREKDTEVADAQFALFLNAMYPVDAFIRDYFRKTVLDALAGAKIPVKIVGEGWEKYKSPNEAYITRERPVVFGLSYEKIARANVLLNVSPFFNHGAHDRIFAGMANHCAVLTDENPYLRRNFSDGGEMCMYSLRDLSTLTERAGKLLEDKTFRGEILEAAYAEFLRSGTWERRAERLLEFVSRGA